MTEEVAEKQTLNWDAVYTDEQIKTLTIYQYRILGYYVRRNRTWPDPLINIANTCKISKAMVSMTIKELVTLGLVEPHPHQIMIRSGFVYVIVDELGNYKIGWADNVEMRLAELQIGNAQKLTLVASIWVEDVFALESELHQQFELKHIRGEWFALSEDDIEYIKRATQ